MSLMTTNTVRAVPRPTPATVPPRAFRVIRGTVDRPRPGMFAAICAILTIGGLLSALILNAAMAKGAFALHDLQRESTRLDNTTDALRHSIDASSAPAQLARQAMSLGMVPSSSAAFLDLRTGKVLGVAKPAKADPGFTVVTSPVPVAPPQAAPKPTVTTQTKGAVTTTTTTTRKPDGSVVTTVTVVDAAKGTRTTTTRTTPAPTVKPAKPAKPAKPVPAGHAATPTAAH